MEPLIIIGLIALIVGLGVLSYLGAKKRREALMALAAKLGLGFNPAHDRELAKQYSFLDRLRTGSNRYAFNVLSGPFQGQDVMVFDYHYETHSTDAQGHSQTQSHHFSCFLLRLPASLPELIIVREGFFSKMVQALGYGDIDFESHEFSRRFCVRSRDKKFAYDICHARMMEYLLANDDLSIEIENTTLAVTFDNRLDPEQIEANLNRLIALRSLMPDYLFSGR